MNPDDIFDALIEACKTVAQARGLNPQIHGFDYAEPATPAIDFQPVVISRTDQTLAGGAARETGQLTATVIVAYSQQYLSAAHVIAIYETYPKALRLPITGGVVTVSDVPTIRTGFQSGETWRVPVVIPYLAEAT